MNTFAGLYPGEILFKVVNPQGAMIFDRDGSTPLGTGSIPPGTTIGGTPRGDGYIVEVSQKPYVGWVHALDLNQLTSSPPSPVLASGYYAGDGAERMMPATGCPQGTYWNDMYGKCMPAGIPAPPPPPAVGFWPYFPPPHIADVGCDDCDTVVSGDPCSEIEDETVASAFFNPIGAALSARRMKECRERRMRHEHHGRGHHHHHHRTGWDGEGGWEHHHRHHRPWWEQFYVGQTPAGDGVKAPAHPAVQIATTQATQAPAVKQATTQAAQSPVATPSHVSDVSQAATHAQGATAAATTATQAAPTAPHPETATSAASSARNAATQARSATAAAAHPAAPGTRASKAARTSAAHASRAASHAHAATETPHRGQAQAHERAAHAHTRAAAAHARIAHGEARRGLTGRRDVGVRREWWSRPEFADYERRYGARWWERPEFGEFRWRYGGEWWLRPEFVDYERRYGARWWERPEFLSYARYYEQEDQPEVVVVPAGGEGQAICILPGDDGSCLKEMVTRPDGAIFYRVTDAGQAAGIGLDQDEIARNAALGMDGAQMIAVMPPDDGDDTATSGDFAGWGHGGGDLFTDPYGRFDPRLPSAWDTQFMNYPDYYYGFGPRVGIQSGPAIVGVQSGPAIVGVQSGPAIVGAMAEMPRGMQGGFYDSSPEIEQQSAMAQIEAMYPSFATGGFEGDLPGTYPGYGFGGWGFWGHGF